MVRPLPGAVAFVQRFDSALQLTPHFQLLLPEAAFEAVGGQPARLHPLPPPTDGEVERLTVRVARRVLALLRGRGETAIADTLWLTFRARGPARRSANTPR